MEALVTLICTLLACSLGACVGLGFGMAGLFMILSSWRAKPLKISVILVGTVFGLGLTAAGAGILYALHKACLEELGLGATFTCLFLTLIPFAIATVDAKLLNGRLKEWRLPVPARDKELPHPNLMRRLGATLPNASVALLFLLALRGVANAWTDATHLCRLMQVEFLVIHSMGFLGLLVLSKVENLLDAILRGCLALGLMGMYGLFAVKIDGLTGGLEFLSAAFATYAGIFFTGAEDDMKSQVIKRWIVTGILFLVLAGVFRMPESVNSWRGDACLRYGMAYFALLALMEASGLYNRRWMKKTQA